MRGLLLPLLASAILAGATGCAKSSESPAPPLGAVAGRETAPASDPAQALYDKLHAGAYQLDSALDSLQNARESLGAILPQQGGDTHEALLNLVDLLDSAGDTLAEYNVAPDVSEVKRDSASAEKRRQSAIDDSNEALKEIRDARGTLADMLESAPPAKEKAAIQKADDATSEAADAIADGIRLLGGTVTSDDPSKGEAPGNDSPGG